jgi:hypothetical protein
MLAACSGGPGFGGFRRHVANESTNFTTPTSTFSFGVIKAVYPDQFV